MSVAPAAKKRPSPSAAAAEPAAPTPSGACQTPGACGPAYVQAAAGPGGIGVGGQAAGTGNGTAVHAIARQGVAAVSSPLPFASTIQSAFGRHDVSHVRSGSEGAASAAASQLGARAFTVGDRIGFRRTPDLRLAAHEAAHVVQQKAGVQLDGGVGKAGDRYERQADEAAEAVVSGRSAEAILDREQGGGEAGVQMACSCGGTCASCSGSLDQRTAPVQMELDSLSVRDFEPAVVELGASGAPGRAGAPAAAAGGGGTEPAAADASGAGSGTQGTTGGAGGGGGGGCASAAQSGTGSSGNGASSGTGAVAAGAQPAPNPAVAGATQTACPAPEEPPQHRPEQSDGEQDTCRDPDELAPSRAPTQQDSAGTSTADQPADPPATEVHGDVQSSSTTTSEAQQTQPTEAPPPPPPPPGCEPPQSGGCGEANSATPEAQGPAATGGEGREPAAPQAEAGGAGPAAAGAPEAAGGAAADAEDPMAAAIGDALARRDETLAAYTDGQAAIGDARSLVNSSAGERAEFSPEGDRVTRETANGAATESLRAMGEEAASTLTDLERAVFERISESLIGVKRDIDSTRDRTLDAIDAEYDAAQRSAAQDANAAKGTINAQYVMTVVHTVTTTINAMVGVQAGAARTTTAIGAAEAAELGVVRNLIARGQEELNGVGAEKGGEAMGIGRAFWRRYHRGRINRRDSVLDGHLTDRRADARSNAAMETAKGYRDGFVNEAAAQARQLARARAGHCATVISASLGAQDGIRQGAGQALETLGQMLTGGLAAAAAQRDARLAAVDAQLAAQLRTLARQRHAQRQAARDAAYLQRLMVESAAHGIAGELLNGAAQAGRAIAGALGQLRNVLAGTPAAAPALVRAALRGVRGRVTLLISGLRERLESGLDRAVASVESNRERAQAALDRLVDTTRDAAGQLSGAFSGAMGQAAQSAVEGFSQARSEHGAAVQRLTTTVAHTFGCALLTVLFGYIRLNQSIRDGIAAQRTSLADGFRLQIDGGTDREGQRKPGLAADIRQYACIAAQNERPAWEKVLTVLLVILIAIAVSVLLGPVIGAAIGGMIGAGLLATVITGIIVGAIAGALSSMAGYVVGNALAGRRITGAGLWHAGWTGALTGAIGGGLGGLGGALVQAAGQAGANLLTRFTVQLVTDMVTEYASQVTMNLVAGRGLASFSDLDPSGFLMAGVMSSAMFTLHNVRLPGNQRPVMPEAPHGRAVEAGRMPRPLAAAGRGIAAAERGLSRAASFVGARAPRVAAVGRALSSTGGAALRTLGRTRLVQALGRGQQSFLNVTERLAARSSYRTYLAMNRRFGRPIPPDVIAAYHASFEGGQAPGFSATGAHETTTPHEGTTTPREVAPTTVETAPRDAATTSPETSTTPHEGSTPHEPTPPSAETATPRETGTPETTTPRDAAATSEASTTPREPSASDRATLEETRSRDDLTPNEARAERRVAEQGPHRESAEPPFTEVGELPNGHRWGETAEGTFCRFSTIKCYDAFGRELPPPEGARAPEAAAPREQASPQSIRERFEVELARNPNLEQRLSTIESSLRGSQRDAALNTLHDQLASQQHTLRTARVVRQGQRMLLESDPVRVEAERIIRLRSRNPARIIEAPSPLHQIAEFASREPVLGESAARTRARGERGLVRQVASLHESVPVHEQQQQGTNVIVRPEDTYAELLARLSDSAGSADAAARDVERVLRTGRLPPGVRPNSDYGARLARLYRLQLGIEPGRVGTQLYDAAVISDLAARLGSLDPILDVLPAAFQGRLRGTAIRESGARAGTERVVRNPGASPTARRILGAAESPTGARRLPQSGYSAESADAMLLRFSELYRTVDPNLTPEQVAAILRRHYGIGE